MVLCLGDSPMRFLCYFWGISSFVDVLYFVFVVLHSFPGYFIMSPALQPWILRPVKTSTSLELYPDYFWLPFLFHLLLALRFRVGIFYPQIFFTLCSFQTFLAQPAFIKASLGAGSYSLKFAGFHTDPGNSDPAHLFVWFTVIHNPLYILNLYWYMSILQKFYLW